MNCGLLEGFPCADIEARICGWFGQELESILDRAASQLTGDKAVQVPEDVFWFATQVHASGPLLDQLCQALQDCLIQDAFCWCSSDQSAVLHTKSRAEQVWVRCIQDVQQTHRHSSVRGFQAGPAPKHMLVLTKWTYTYVLGLHDIRLRVW